MTEKGPNDLLKYSGLGMQFFLTIAICGWLGYKMDEWWREGQPLFVIIMIFLGTVGGFYQLYRATKEK
ncbi:MAG: AtpZ/AtpI family protein [Roseivirga sp.]|nr:AtpZ/AtpI family protein [Roseivirga sp.]